MEAFKLLHILFGKIRSRTEHGRQPLIWMEIHKVVSIEITCNIVKWIIMGSLRLICMILLRPKEVNLNFQWETEFDMQMDCLFRRTGVAVRPGELTIIWLMAFWWVFELQISGYRSPLPPPQWNCQLDPWSDSWKMISNRFHYRAKSIR